MRTHVDTRSVEKVIIALVAQESVLLIPEVRGTRLRTIEVDPVFPERSVATILIVLSPHERETFILYQLPVQRVARAQFTVTLATHPESETVPKSVGVPVTRALLRCDVIAIIGLVVSGFAVTMIVRDTMVDAFPAASTFQYWRR